MDIALTLVCPRGSRPAVDLVLSAAPGTRFGRVRREVAAQVGSAGAELSCGTRLVNDEDVLGEPPLVHGATLVAGPAVPAGRQGVLEVHVRSGPDSGTIHRLGPGEHVVGRAARAAVPLADPDASRTHALVVVGPAGSVVRDLGSTNGTTIDGDPVGVDGTPWRPGQVLALGSTTLELVRPETDPASCLADRLGAILVNRPPRLLMPEDAARFNVPAPPPEAPRTRLPLIAMAVPLVLGVALAAMAGSAMYLLFALMSPAMLLGTYVGDRVGGRRTGRADASRHAERVAAVRAAVLSATAAQARRRHEQFAGAATVLEVASTPQPRLWERHPCDADFLELRVGLGTVRSTVEVREPAADGAPECTEHPPLENVPVTVPLAAAGVTGLAGDRSVVLAVARFVVGQVATWHSHLQVRLVVLAAEDTDDWRWLRWLPHTGEHPGAVSVGSGIASPATKACLDLLTAELDARLAEAATAARPAARPAFVTVLDGAESLRRRAEVARLLELGPQVGLFFLCLGSSVVALPTECRCTVEVTGDAFTRLRVVQPDGSSVEDVVLDGVGPRWAERLARALAPLRDSTPDDEAGGLPDTARLLDLLRLNRPDAASVAAAWTRGAGTAATPIGVRPDGDPFVLDLAKDGPHLLIAGTTGSGKSELLQSLIAGLATAVPPDRLSFLLVDYKGGAAFADCAALPHTAGLVTDLDGALTERALQSLGAELRRRERLLRDSGRPDLESYNLGADVAGSLPLARLVLVVDEFATLADELPDFLGGLVSIAQRGRSLGVHLVLATQRPAGVVNADIRANASLRIALRVSDPSESVDVVDRPDAASLPRHLPGRAVIRAGTGALETMQAARVTLAGTSAPAAPQVRTWDWTGGRATPARRAADDGPSDLSLLVAACRQATEDLGLLPAPSPWLPPLPSLLRVADLPAAEGGAPVGAAAVLGLVDLPEQQSAAPFQFTLQSGEHLLVAGGPRSGRTTLLRTLAGTLLGRHAPADLHVYAFDSGGGLAALRTAASCGAVVSRDETARGSRLLELLCGELESRQRRLSAAGVGDLAELRARTDPEPPPWLLVLVDGWETFQDSYEQVDHGRPLERLLRLARDGAPAGFRLVVTGGRPLLTSRLGSGFGRRLVLPMPDPLDYALAGLPLRSVPAALPPGRALVAPDGSAMQVAVLGSDAAGAAQLRELRRMCAVEAGAAPPSGLLRVESLPHRVSFGDIAADGKQASPHDRWVLLGLGGDSAGPVGVDLRDDGPWFLVTGPPRSGRSTALLTATTWLLEQGRPVLVVAGRRSPLRTLAGRPNVSLAGEDLCAGDLLARADLTVVVDDAEALRDGPVERALLDAAALDDHARLEFLVSATTSEAATAFRGLAAEARRGRTGLLLGDPAPGDGDVFGLRLPGAAGGTPAGRGLLVVSGSVTPVQVADPT